MFISYAYLFENSIHSPSSLFGKIALYHYFAIEATKASLYEFYGNYSEALKIWNKLKLVESKNKVINNIIIKLNRKKIYNLMLNNKWDDLINFLGQLMKISPLKIEELICLGIAYQHLKDYHMALHYFYVASLVDPNNYLSYLAQANLHGLLKKKILSQVNYKKAMELTDNDYIILLNQANLLLSQKNYSASYNLLLNSSKICDNKKLIYQELARYFLLVGNQKKAYSFIKKSFNSGNHSPALFMLINYFENKYKMQFPQDIINNVEKKWKTWYETFPENVLLFHLQYKFLP